MSDIDDSDLTGRTSSKTSQWSLGLLLLLIFEVGLFISLVMQLYHVGFVLFLYITGVVVGIHFRKWRWFSGSFTALVVFVAVYGICWVRFGDAKLVHVDDYAFVDTVLQEFDSAIRAYSAQSGQLPSSLSEVEIRMPDLRRNTWKWSSYRRSRLVDPWNAPFHYSKTADGFELGSFGRDNVAGGVGLDADIFVGRPHHSKLPLRQFLFEMNRRLVVFGSTLLGSFAAGLVLLIPVIEAPLNRVRLMGTVLASSVSAIFLCVMLTGIYLSAWQTGP